MREIQLTQGKIALVDDGDYDALIGFPWFAARHRHHWYAVYATGRAEVRKHHRMHTILMNPEPGFEVDHIDGNGLNNTRTNLRVVRQGQNAKNRRKVKPGTSVFKGVSWKPSAGKWVSRIMVDKRPIFIGYFSDEVAAAVAYNEAALKYHGEFARLNLTGVA